MVTGWKSCREVFKGNGSVSEFGTVKGVGCFCLSFDSLRDKCGLKFSPISIMVGIWSFPSKRILKACDHSYRTE